MYKSAEPAGPLDSKLLMWLCGLYGHLLLHATIAPKIGGKN
jgi:hypothetical protein